MEVPTSPEVHNRPTAALSRSEFLTRQEVLTPEAPLAPAQPTGQGVRRPLLVHDGECQDQVQGVLLGVRQEPLLGEVSALHAHIGSTVKNRGFLLFVSACFFSSIIISFSLHKWIFDVIILDENLNRVRYGPLNANSDPIDNNAPSGEIMTAWLPSVFFADHYPLQFAYVEAPQTLVSQLFAVYFHPLL
ncbi:hypothetical protein RHSIM_RhsimUnG0141600 [Rhododendron simsii]|uniref:Uncharacterized protein n=1 Tax=Rhododendron simsii TaxID=118357 RepID=A0A834FV41_RHOSS|nr:hypothetical protein RHSIM_RhsimUnG0141600 [Rhododendron simsii]